MNGANDLTCPLLVIHSSFIQIEMDEVLKKTLWMRISNLATLIVISPNFLDFSMLVEEAEFFNCR